MVVPLDQKTRTVKPFWPGAADVLIVVEGEDYYFPDQEIIIHTGELLHCFAITRKIIGTAFFIIYI
jgi:hypothetical protein